MRIFMSRRERDALDERAVLTAIEMLRPEVASIYPIGRLARIGWGRTTAALARLGVDGRVTSRWAGGPAPRRRLYSVGRELA